MGLVTGAMGSLLPKMVQLLKEEYNLQIGVRKKIESLLRELDSVYAVLRVVGESMEPAGPHMLRRLRKKIGKLFKKVKVCRKIAGAIQDIDKKLKEVAARCGRYTVDDIVVAKPEYQATIDPRLLNLFKKATELVGIDGPMDELIEMLALGDDIHPSMNKPKVISIFGFGGLGKTTLAKAVYDKFKPGFDSGAFVPIGQHPDMKNVLRDILIDLDKQRYMHSIMTLLDERQLMNELQEFIQKKRYVFRLGSCTTYIF
uniref:Uncharacterized protein n=1 Tax=Oryza glaberrima TaxID=4538 RepID=I1QMA9_ORYGL